MHINVNYLRNSLDNFVIVVSLYEMGGKLNTDILLPSAIKVYFSTFCQKLYFMMPFTFFGFFFSKSTTDNGMKS